MTEASQESDIEDLPEAAAVPKRQLSLQLVWIIPIVAALIGGWLAVKAIRERGPTITISFKTAEGIDTGKTTIQYKDVDIGEVRGITLSDDGSRVIATAKVDKEAEKFLIEDTRFWVVRPRIAGGQASALGTLLSGSYIGVDPGDSDKLRHHFVGLEIPPLITTDRRGRVFTLHAEDLGSLDIGQPVYFRHFQVGEVTGYKLDEDGKGVTVRIFVDAPYDREVRTETRFWNASGINLTLDAGGIQLRTQSLISILIGGIAFETPPDSQDTPRAAMHTAFTLFEDQAQAMQRRAGEVEKYVLYFTDSLHGLSVGAPVEFNGIELGEVTSLQAEWDKDAQTFRFPVYIAYYPNRLGAQYREAAKRARAIEGGREKVLNALVEHGLRAQLKSGNLVTGQLYVALDFFPDAPTAKIKWSNQPIELPTVPGGLEGLQTALGKITNNLANIPLAKIGTRSQRALKTLNLTLKNLDEVVQELNAGVVPAARNAFVEVHRTIAGVDRTLASDNPLQVGVRDTLYQIMRAAQSVRNLTDYLQQHPAALIRGKAEE
jgi:paraquat-inducible protein B